MEWEQALDLCEEMMNDSDYDFALETIEGIHDWIEENETVTEKQVQALHNIQSTERY